MQLRRVNFYTICFLFGLIVLLILTGNRYANNTYHPNTETRRKIRQFLKVEVGEEGFLQPIPTLHDGSPDIERLLEKTRTKIKSELSTYNFSKSGVDSLEDLLMESGGRPLRSVIISTFRSGTTFLGEVLNSIPGTHYHYEPLSSYGAIQRRGSPEADKAISTLKDLLKCKYDNLDDYFEFGRTHLYQFSCSMRLWDICKYKKELCYGADFTSRFCKLFPFQSMKVVRLRLQLMQEIFDDKELNVKVVLLIRDPRGVIQSRLHRSLCQPSPDCWKPSRLCADMVSDYVAAGRLLEQYPDRLMIIRYEELALKPNLITRRILKFLKLSATKSFEEFLMSHTNVEIVGGSSTFRVSRDTPFRWKNLLDYDYVDEIQMACKEAMSLWGYRIADNASHLASKEFNPVEDYTISQ